LNLPLKWRLAIYWFASFAGTGLVAEVARFPVYSGAGSLGERFMLYAWPLPMGLGMFKVPVLLAGTLVCIHLGRTNARRYAVALTTLLSVALCLHALAQFSGEREHWFIFAYVTFDLAALATLASTKGREMQIDGG